MFNANEYVYEVYKERSFSKAAKNLFISQPSLSGTIKRVEEEIGYEIFDRSTKPIGVTDIGEKYIKTIEKILKLERHFIQYVNDVDDLKAGNVSVGGTQQYTSYMLPAIVSKFIEKYPHINVDIVEAKTSSLIRYLNEGIIDIAIDNYSYDEEDYSRQFQTKDTMILTVPKSFSSNENLKNYALSFEEIKSGEFKNDDIPFVKLSEFKDENFILLKEGNDTRTRAHKKFVNENISPKVLLEVEQQITSYNLTAYGLGISFISDYLIRNVGDNDSLCYYKLENYENDRDICFYYLKNKYITKAQSEFLKMAKETL
ncbi:LysR family transcriptional regulator [Mediannikoviicoccus vaginalis]|uniref:LysR family transcriptional regulator n=1 Tax=Mediannikoviicoccus vaginalis TaxID=2899727 RepID=UPI001F442C02|nr:LysR family transcriptional regulator [Mediannikoviicoccus vaginalis]